MSRGSLRLTASKTISSENSFCSLSRIGMLIRQGPHQVAQKSSITIFPRNCASETVRPSRSESSNGGAGPPMSLCSSWRGPEYRRNTTLARRTTTINDNVLIFISHLGRHQTHQFTILWALDSLCSLCLL